MSVRVEIESENILHSEASALAIGRLCAVGPFRGLSTMECPIDY